MLNCVYHPVEEMQVVDDAERDRLLATGVWFDHPNKAKAMREKIENDIKNERNEKVEPKPKARRNKNEK